MCVSWLKKCFDVRIMIEHPVLINKDWQRYVFFKNNCNDYKNLIRISIHFNKVVLRSIDPIYILHAGIMNLMPEFQDTLPVR
jgi:hypothetical protein